MRIHVLTYTFNHHSFHTCAYCIFSISLVPRDFHTVAENLHDNGSVQKSRDGLTVGHPEFEEHTQHITALDGKYAFGDEEHVYMVQRPGFHSGTNTSAMCRLKKSLYGLKQARSTWVG